MISFIIFLTKSIREFLLNVKPLLYVRSSLQPAVFETKTDLQCDIASVQTSPNVSFCDDTTKQSILLYCTFLLNLEI